MLPTRSSRLYCILLSALCKRTCRPQRERGGWQCLRLVTSCEDATGYADSPYADSPGAPHLAAYNLALCARKVICTSQFGYTRLRAYSPHLCGLVDKLTRHLIGLSAVPPISHRLYLTRKNGKTLAFQTFVREVALPFRKLLIRERLHSDYSQERLVTPLYPLLYF